MGLNVHVIECNMDPNVTPEFVGQHWINTDTGEMWFSNGTASVANWILNDTGVDIKVKVSANDTTPGYLLDKITAAEGSNTSDILELYEMNDGADEDLEFRIDQSKIEVTSSQVTDFDEAAQDAVGNILTDTASIDFTYNDAGDQITAVVIPGGIDHGSLAGLGDDDHTQYLTETRHDALPADNPHSVTFTQAVTADAGTDITAAEAETLTDGSNADTLHTHAASLDDKVRVSSNDTTPGYLLDKATATEGSNATNILELYEANDAGDEDLEFRIDESKISITESQISDLSHYAHPNHTGEVTSIGDGAQTVDKTAITNKTTIAADGADFVLVSDTDDSGNLKKVAISDLLDDTDTGEDNTASNVGTAGVGVFKQKTGVDLEFRNINAASNKVSVILDGANNEIDIDVNEANLTITESQISDLTHTVNTDESVKVSANDTTAGYLLNKVIAADESNSTSAIEIKEVNDGGDEDLKIAFDETKLTITESQISDLAHTLAYKTINTPAGTDPVAATTTDTLNLTTSDNTVVVTGTAGSDTIDFKVDPSNIDLNDLGDVTITTVSDDDILQYNSVSGEWENTTLAGLNGQLDHGNLLGLGDDDHLQYLTETRHDALPSDNPHNVTFTQVVTADGGTDITAAEAETLTDGSNADALHTHAANLDEKAKVSANDTTAKFLEDAVVASEGTNSTNILEITTLNDGANEDLQFQVDQTKISITESQISDLSHTTNTDETVKISANDTTAGYLLDKATATEGSNTTNILELYEANDAGDEDLEFRIDESKITITESQISDLSHYTHPNHTGEVTSIGDGVQTLDKTAITNQTTVAPVPGDFVLVSDTSDSGNLKKVNISDLIGATGTDCPAVQVRRTTDYVITTGFVDLTFDTTDVETDATVLEHDNVNTDRILIKEAGLYNVHYHTQTEITGSAIFNYRVRANDTTILAGSETFRSDAGDTFPNGATFLCMCAAGDFLSLQVNRSGGSGSLKADTSFIVTKCAGARGEAGATGAGANIIVQEDDITVGTVTDTLNFEGSGVSSVVDEGTNKTTVTISGGLFGSQFQFSESLSQSTTTSSSFQQKLRLTTSGLPSGEYIINWSADIGGSSDKKVAFRVQLNDSINLSETDFKIKGGGVGNSFAYIPMGGHAIKTLSGINTIDIDYRENDDTAAIKNARLTLWRVN